MGTLWQEVWTTIQADFSDLPEIAQVTQMTVRLLPAALCTYSATGWSLSR